MNREEDSIQIAIVQYLEIKKHFYYSIPNEAIGAGKNKQQAAARGHKLKLMGRRAGVADLFIYWAFGGNAYLEVKSKIGKQSKAQKQFEKDVIARGHEYFIVRSVDDVIELEKKLRGSK
jgi:hypothetical protein